MKPFHQFRYVPGWFKLMATGACPARATVINGASRLARGSVRTATDCWAEFGSWPRVPVVMCVLTFRDQSPFGWQRAMPLSLAPTAGNKHQAALRASSHPLARSWVKPDKTGASRVPIVIVGRKPCHGTGSNLQRFEIGRLAGDCGWRLAGWVWEAVRLGVLRSEKLSGITAWDPRDFRAGRNGRGYYGSRTRHRDRGVSELARPNMTHCND
jgi:hypothetical protein